MINDGSAELIEKHPDRFGAFATLPSDGPDQALAELTHALDELRLDGVVLTSNMAGRYFGDPPWNRCWPKLARRQVPVFVHPTDCPYIDVLGFGRPSSIVEFPFDTARNITNALYTGVFQRHPGLRLILAHCGGALPTLGWRIGEHTVMGRGPDDADIDPTHVAQVLRGLYYETALAGSRNSLLPPSRSPPRITFLFGTDWPAAPEPTVVRNIDNLTSSTASPHRNCARSNGTTRSSCSPVRLSDREHPKALSQLARSAARATGRPVQPEHGRHEHHHTDRNGQVSKPSPTTASGASLPVAATMPANTTPNRLSPTISPVAISTPSRFLQFDIAALALGPAVVEAAEQRADRDEQGQRHRQVHAHADGQRRSRNLPVRLSTSLIATTTAPIAAPSPIRPQFRLPPNTPLASAEISAACGAASAFSPAARSALETERGAQQVQQPARSPATRRPLRSPARPAAATESRRPTGRS